MHGRRSTQPPRREPPARPSAPSEGSPPLGRRLHDLVEQEVRRRVARSPGGHLVNGRLADLDLRLDVSLRDPEAGAERLAQALDEQIARFVDEAVEEAAAFRPGRAFCHRCESSDCAHAAPPGPRAAFAGYSPTGVPRWTDFGQLCLEQRHPLVDRLYDEDHPSVLLLALDGASLKADLLPGFQASVRRHDLSGQLCAGLFPIPGLPGGERGIAVTIQAVVTERRRGGPRVGLNVLAGGAACEEAVAAAPPESRPWRGALLWGQARCAEIGRELGRRGPPREAVERRVAGVLRGLMRRIEHDLRGRERRTRHAEERHRGGERPTRKALDDLRVAGPADLFVDARHGTLVVLGERGRAHFFTAEGRLVSSVRYAKDGIARKARLGIWRPASAEEAAGLRGRVEEAGECPSPRDPAPQARGGGRA